MLGALTALILGAFAAQPALGSGSSRTRGTPTAGKAIFAADCAVCHTLKAADAAGTIGPDLDNVKLAEATIVKAVNNGGATVMTKAAAAKYPTQMVAYKGALTNTQIQDVAAFVYSSTHPATPSAAKPKLTLNASGHTPKINVRWAYTVRATTRGKPTAAKITAQIVDPLHHLHPVQFGTSKKNITNWRFTGRFSDFIIWPPSSRGVPLTFRATLVAGKTKTVISYRVTPKK